MNAAEPMPSRALYDLLLESFSNEELCQLVERLPEGRRILFSVPSARAATRTEYVYEVVSVLERHGVLMGPEFFDIVRAARPKHAGSVADVARRFGVQLGPFTPGPAVQFAGDKAHPPGSQRHQREGRLVHVLIISISGVLSFVACCGGIYAISQAARSASEFEALGVRLKTGDVGVALVGLGLVLAFFTTRAVLRNQHDLAKLP